MLNRLIEFVKDEQGATAIEYAIILMLIGIASVSAFTFAGSSLDASFSDTASKIPR